MWIFGYGSLIWKADFPYRRKLIGYIKGYTRRFYQHSVDHRGIPEKPGRVVTLLPAKEDEKVWGVAYEISEKDREHVTDYLDFREKNGYSKDSVIFYPIEESDNISNEKPFQLTLYVATKENISFAGEAPIEDIAKQIATSVGPSGTNKEYVYKLASAMRLIFPGIQDDHLFNLEAAVKSFDNDTISNVC